MKGSKLYYIYFYNFDREGLGGAHVYILYLRY
jgi:hypothetical protein